MTTTKDKTNCEGSKSGNASWHHTTATQLHAKVKCTSEAQIVGTRGKGERIRKQNTEFNLQKESGQISRTTTNQRTTTQQSVSTTSTAQTGAGASRKGVITGVAAASGADRIRAYAAGRQAHFGGGVRRAS